MGWRYYVYNVLILKKNGILSSRCEVSALAQEALEVLYELLAETHVVAPRVMQSAAHECGNKSLMAIIQLKGNRKTYMAHSCLLGCTGIDPE